MNFISTLFSERKKHSLHFLILSYVKIVQLWWPSWFHNRHQNTNFLQHHPMMTFWEEDICYIFTLCLKVSDASLLKDKWRQTPSDDKSSHDPISQVSYNRKCDFIKNQWISVKAYLSQRIFIGCVVGWIVINNQIIRSHIAIAKKW